MPFFVAAAERLTMIAPAAPHLQGATPHFYGEEEFRRHVLGSLIALVSIVSPLFP